MPYPAWNLMARAGEPGWQWCESANATPFTPAAMIRRRYQDQAPPQDHDSYDPGTSGPAGPT